MKNMIRYTTSLEGISTDMLAGFFVGWPNGPSTATHLRILKGSNHVVLAIDDEARRVVGFITAISDGIISAYIALVEVLPEYERKGIGTQLVGRSSICAVICTWLTSPVTSHFSHSTPDAG